MAEQFTKHDRKILAIWRANSKSQWDNIAAAGGYPHRKAAQKAVRRVIKKLALPDPPTGSPNPPAPTPQARRKNGLMSRKGANLTIMRNGMYNTRPNTCDGQRNVEEEGQGLDREGAGEGKPQDAVEGVGQGMDQGSDRFVVGRPYNEKVDRDFRQSHRDALRGDESSEDDDDNNDDDSEDEMEV
ncbi:hypothetical protein KC360_g5513 [Hortaea werneckii]|nr:hypothetical protein KC325_g6810 [Hortaea werneckii]KAI6991699.1 hypothetical protein KC359_g6081 [Hortaea werneckii]KAI7144310.1 hypothetical protein KC344_g5518 [Hortaea werneckii]KAI7172444.1 hypothetical protein KC360_g5513 [Hortaea werneckii]KAI7512913.1 hypothetical protein KC347_g1977 [Hortaea werneckii]